MRVVSSRTRAILDLEVRPANPGALLPRRVEF
jgi:hypothetical protein